ncbi:Porin [Azospirillaceae bacterium]
MKRFLLAGCAVAALAYGVGSANAADVPNGKFQILMGGDAFFQAGAVSQDRSSDQRVTEFNNRFRLVITPQAKADNGITYGARLRIRAAGLNAAPNTPNSAVDHDRAFLFAEGKFGRVEAGGVNSPNDQAYAVGMTGHPMDFQALAIYDAWQLFTRNDQRANTLNNTAAGAGVVDGLAFSQWTGGASTVGYQLPVAANAGTRVNYFTPRFSGFQATFSYLPRTDSNAVDVTRGSIVTNATPFSSNFQDVYEIGANYTNTFNGWKVQGGVAYVGGDASKGVSSATNLNKFHDLSAVQAGMNVSYSGFTLGGGYLYMGKSGYTKAPYIDRTGTTKAATAAGNVTTKLSDQQSWNVGVQYATGSQANAGTVVAGVKFASYQDAGNLAVAGKRTTDAVTFGAMYTIAPGFLGGMEGTFYENKSDRAKAAAFSPSDSGSVWLLRSAVVF